MMYKMLIADDEKTIIDGIKESINWKSYDIEVIGTAENGIQALELFKAHQPDIVISDIRMPGLSGLELIEEMGKHFPDTKIILISAFEEFEYAKKALELGVSAYMTKPLKKQLIIDEVCKAREEIKTARTIKEDQEKYEKLYARNLPVLRKHLLNNLLMGKVEFNEDFTRELEYYSLNIDFSNICVLVCRLDSVEGKASSYISKEIQIKYLMIEKLMGEYLSGLCGCIVFQSYNNEVVALLGSKEEAESFLRRIISAAEMVKDDFLDVHGETLTIGVGRIASSVHNCPLSYQSAVKALEYRLIYGDNTVIYIGDVEVNGEEQYNLFYGLNEELTNLQNIISLGKSDEVIKLVEKILGKFIENKNIPYYYVQQIYCQLLSILLRVLAEKDIQPEKIFGMTVNIYGDLFSKRTGQELKSWYEGLIKAASEAIVQKKSPKVNNVIASAVEYMNSNCDKELSLPEVAEHVYLAPSYFSKVFREETGVQFIEYVKNLKIERAKKLLKGSNKKIYEICEELGYQSVQYFSTLFKNIVGMTPHEYKTKGN